MRALPESTKALVLCKSSTSQTNHVYHNVAIESRPIPSLKPGEILVRMTAIAFNRRDLWIRLGQYPGIALGSVLGSDGVGLSYSEMWILNAFLIDTVAGQVIGSFDPQDILLRQRVFLVPMRGWESDPNAPESDLCILGGVGRPPLGTFAEYVVVERDQVILAPDHLDDIHLAAWPLGGLTAWRFDSNFLSVKISLAG